MKKFLFSAVFMFPTLLFAAPWGLFDDYMAPREESRTEPAAPGERYLLAHVLSGKPIRVHVDMRADVDKYDKYASLVQENYNRWFTETARQIRRTKREGEFADLLPLLERGISLELVGRSQEPDIVIMIAPLSTVLYYCEKAVGCYSKPGAAGWDVPVIFLSEDKNWQKILSFGQMTAKRIGLHEIGHSLGLSDQYAQTRASNSHPVYHSPVHDGSVMESGGSLTCDDADGVINAIDITRRSGRGGELGWKSLCRREVYYVHGAPVEAGPYAVRPWDDGRTWELESYENGVLKNRERFALAEQGLSPLGQALRETVQRRDGAGRPVLARGAQGETIYYSYVYGKKTRFITVQGAILAVEMDNPLFQLRGKSKKYHSQDFYFGEDGKISLIRRIRPLKAKGAEGTAVYLGRLGDNGRWNEEMEINFDKRGDVKSMTSSSRNGPENVHASPVAAGLEGAVRRSTVNALEERLKQWYLKQLK